MKRLFLIGLFVNVVLVAAVIGLPTKEGIEVAHAAGGGGTPKGNGDVNGDGMIDISDGIYILSWLFTGGEAPVSIECQPSDVLEGFTSLGENAQGYPEYRHDQTGIIFVRLPGGWFSMGSPEGETGRLTREGPVHRVNLSPFLIAKYELTQAEWEAVMGSNPSEFTGDDSRPVEQISWDDIQGFEETTGLTLPTEAQWEYACRAGTEGPYAGTGNLNDMGWYSANSGSTTHPVGQKQPNQFGLYDMHGNVEEWCEDAYNSGFYDQPQARGLDPVSTFGSLSSGALSVRGGCWRYTAVAIRSAGRDWGGPMDKFSHVGIRPAMPIPKEIPGFRFSGINEKGKMEYEQEETGILFVYLPGGTFNMGSPETEEGHDPDESRVHRVNLSPFLIAKYELTQAEWQAVMGSNPSHFTGDDNRPVERVSWDDIQGFETKTGLTLPTEAQWEYACRAGMEGPYAGTGNLDDMGWYYANSDDTTHPVGLWQPNGFGLYDMHGNVWEWCEDIYDSSFYSKPEAAGPDPISTSGSVARVIRGGGWGIIARGCRSAFRGGLDPGIRDDYLGFRPSRPAP